MKNPNSRVYVILFGSVILNGTKIDGGLFNVHDDKAVIRGELIPLTQLQYMAAFVDKNFQDYYLLNGILVPTGTSLIGATVTNQVTGTDAIFYAAALAAYETRANAMKALLVASVDYLTDNKAYADYLGVPSVVPGDYTINFDATELTEQLMGFLATKYFYELSKRAGQNAAGIVAPGTEPIGFHALIMDVFQKTNKVEVFKKVYEDTYDFADGTNDLGILFKAVGEDYQYEITEVLKNGTVVDAVDYSFKYTIADAALASIDETLLITNEAPTATVDSTTLTVEMFDIADTEQLIVLATKVINIYVNTNVYVLTFADPTLDIVMGSGATSMGITMTVNGAAASPTTLSSLLYASATAGIVSIDNTARTVTPVGVGSTVITASLEHTETGIDLIASNLTVTVTV